MLTLKTVSGRLKQFFWGRDQTATDRVEKTPRNLLVVDDEESICFSMSEYFSQHGFKVDTAREREEAEGLINETEYKVIIQDLRLGVERRSDGIDIIKLVHERNPETRIVVLTSMDHLKLKKRLGTPEQMPSCVNRSLCRRWPR